MSDDERLRSPVHSGGGQLFMLFPDMTGWEDGSDWLFLEYGLREIRQSPEGCWLEKQNIKYRFLSGLGSDDGENFYVFVFDANDAMRFKLQFVGG